MRRLCPVLREIVGMQSDPGGRDAAASSSASAIVDSLREVLELEEIPSHVKFLRPGSDLDSDRPGSRTRSIRHRAGIPDHGFFPLYHGRTP